MLNKAKQDRNLLFLKDLKIEDTTTALSKLGLGQVGLYVSPKWWNTQNGKLMAISAIDLLARMCGLVYIIPSGDFISEFTYWGSGNGTVVYGKPEVCKVILTIGSDILDGVNQVFIDSNGWLTYIGQKPYLKDPAEMQNPIGAMTAAAYGVAEIFKIILKDFLPKRYHCHESMVISTFDYGYGDLKEPNPPLPEEISIGNVTMVGAGAVGMAFANTIKNFNPSGNLLVIDADKVDETNLNRYMSVKRFQVGQLKTEVIANLFSETNLIVTPAPLTYQGFTHRFGYYKHDLVICSVDNIETRQELQSDLPRLILDGATTGSQLRISRHDFLNNACLGCLFPTDKKSLVEKEKFSWVLRVPVSVIDSFIENDTVINEEQARSISDKLSIPWSIISAYVGKPFRNLWEKEVCGRVQMPLPETDVVGTISFVSALPGILLAGELIKERYFKAHCLKQLYQVNTLKGPTRNSLQIDKKSSTCSCYCDNNSMVEAYMAKYPAVDNGG